MMTPTSAKPTEALRDGEYESIVEGIHGRVVNEQVSSPVALYKIGDFLVSLLDETAKSSAGQGAIDALAQFPRRTITQTQDIVRRAGLAHNGSINRRRTLAEEIMLYVPDNEAATR